MQHLRVPARRREDESMEKGKDLNMPSRSVGSALAFIAVISFSPILRAQTPRLSGAGPAQSQPGSSKAADLSGVWGLDNTRGGIGQSISLSDIGGKKRGKEDDIPYQPWSLEKTMSQRPPTGPDASFEDTTDPWINYCEPPGLARIYMEPARTKFIQTPDAVYVLHEVMQTFRIVRLNSKHPEDPDPTWWGDSIGWYENGDTLVVDTIGVNDKTWLDQLGHPHTGKMHLTERYKRVDPNTLELDMTIDDPGAYTKPFPAHRNFTISQVPFMQNPWVCSVRENQEFHEHLANPAVTPPSSK